MTISLQGIQGSFSSFSFFPFSLQFIPWSSLGLHRQGSYLCCITLLVMSKLSTFPFNKISLLKLVRCCMQVHYNKKQTSENITRNKQSLRLQSWPLHFPFLGICSSLSYTTFWLEEASPFLRTEPSQDTMDKRSRIVWCFDDQLNEERTRQTSITVNHVQNLFPQSTVPDPHPPLFLSGKTDGHHWRT